MRNAEDVLNDPIPSRDVTYRDVTHISPYSQGQTCQEGRLVTEDGDRFVVRKVYRDRSIGPEWHDDGPLLDRHTGRAVEAESWRSAMLASAY